MKDPTPITTNDPMRTKKTNDDETKTKGINTGLYDTEVK
jgi:hypothetical protein